MTEHVDNAALLKCLYLVGGIEYMYVYDGCLFTCCLSVHLLFICLHAVCLFPVVCLLAYLLSLYF